MKLLTLDLDRSVPCPEVHPEAEDLYRLYDQAKRSGERFRLSFGKKYSEVWGSVRISIRDDRERLRGQTDWMEAVPFKVVSQKLVDVLRVCGCDCEFLPLIAEYRKRVYHNKYFALNALHVVRKAVDLQKSQISDYDEEIGMAWKLERLVLREDALGDAPLAYLFEIGRHAVSNDLASQIKGSGIIGCRLLEPSEFIIEG